MISAVDPDRNLRILFYASGASEPHYHAFRCVGNTDRGVLWSSLCPRWQAYSESIKTRPSFQLLATVETDIARLREVCPNCLAEAFARLSTMKTNPAPNPEA